MAYDNPHCPLEDKDKDNGKDKGNDKDKDKCKDKDKYKSRREPVEQEEV